MLYIKAKIIHMLEPNALPNGACYRRPLINNESNKNLVAFEATLRRAAYKNVSIITGESFYDDSDMRSDYYLLVIYDIESQTPLLSARYYFDRTVIANYLKGDDGVESPLDVNKFKQGELFLADRLSGNINSMSYRQNHEQIFSLFYWKMYTHNPDRKLVLMARKEKGDKLLKKYVNLGFDLAGSTLLRGKEHWIVWADMKKLYAQNNAAVLSVINSAT